MLAPEAPLHGIPGVALAILGFMFVTAQRTRGWMAQSLVGYFNGWYISTS